MFQFILKMSVTGSLSYLLYKCISKIFGEKLNSKWNYRFLKLSILVFVIPVVQLFFHLYVNYYPKILTIESIDRNSIISFLYHNFVYLFYIWIIGMAVKSAWYIGSYFWFHKSILKYNDPIYNTNILRLFNNCKYDIGVNKNVTLYKNACADTSFTMGLFQSSVIIPDHEYDLNELKYIFKHELNHIKQKDTIVNFLFLIFKIVYWFNPIIYFMNRDSKNLCEYVCDLKVTEAFNKQEKKEYSLLILNSISRFQPASCNYYIAFSENGKRVKKRLEKILENKTMKRIYRSVIILISVFLFISYSIVGVAVTYVSERLDMYEDSFTSIVEEVDESNQIIYEYTEYKTQEHRLDYNFIQKKDLLKSINTGFCDLSGKSAFYSVPFYFSEEEEILFNICNIDNVKLKAGIIDQYGDIRMIESQKSDIHYTFKINKAGKYKIIIINTGGNSIDIMGFITDKNEEFIIEK